MPQIDIRHADQTNERNLKNLADGGSIAFQQARQLVLIGAGHKPEHTRLIGAAITTAAQGTITIRKGKGTDPGELVVRGSHDRSEFETAIKRISKKKVTFQ